MKKHRLFSPLILCAHLFLSTLGLHAQERLLSEEISSSNVTSICEDNLGNMWIATIHGLNKFNGSSYSIYYTRSKEGELINDRFTSIDFCSDGNLWYANECGLGVMEKGKFRQLENIGYDLIYKFQELDESSIVQSDRFGLSKISKKTLEHIGQMADTRFAMSRNLVVNKAHEVWILENAAQSSRIFSFDQHLSRKDSLSLPFPLHVESMTLDLQDCIWLSGTGGKIVCLDTHKKTFVDIPQGLSACTSGHDVVFVKTGKNGTIYFGVKNKGIYAYAPETRHVDMVFPEEKLTEDKYVAYFDSQENLWLSNKKDGLKFYGAKSVYSSLNSMLGVMKTPIIKGLQVDRFDHLWIRGNDDLMCCDKHSGTILRHYTGKIYSFMFIDSKGRLWIIENTVNALCYDVSESGELKLLHSYPFGSNVYSISEDQKGNIWITLFDRFAVIDGSSGISYRNAPEGVSFTRLITQMPQRRMFLYTLSDGIFEYGEDEQFKPVPSIIDNPVSVYLDEKGTYWLGSFNKGLSFINGKEKLQKKYEGPADGMFNSSVKDIVQAGDGAVWVSTSNTIFRVNPKDYSLYYVNDPSYKKNNLYSQFCSCTDYEGNLYFGGSGGVTIVHPQRYNKEGKMIKLNLDNMLVNDVRYDISEGQSVKLDYRQNMVTFWYSGQEYDDGAYLQYSYKLEGYDKNWINSLINKRAFYPKLPSGKFRFLVRVARPGGTWSEPQVLLEFQITPAPWNSWWAWTLYMLLLCGGIFMAFVLIVHIKVRDKKLELAQKGEELRQNQVNFLTNISHEYRTPLSLIYGPLMQLLNSNKLDEKDASLLLLMKKNTDRIKQLTEHILSLDSLQEENLHAEQLEVSLTDLDALLKQTTDNFRFIAHEHNIRVEYFGASREQKSWIDTTKLVSVMSNLLSNAIKYTHYSSAIGEALITVSLRYDQNGYAIVQVEDNGPGIPDDKVNEIFSRHTRFAQDPQVEGSGIGLNYTQHLVKLHKGDILYEKLSPHGSLFTLKLPVEKDEYQDFERIEEEQYMTAPSPASVTLAPVADMPSEEFLKTVMVVEDNVEIRQYINMLLSGKYRVITAQDGQDAVDLLSLQTPDLILSDIVMPRMDGFTLCEKIKQSEQLGYLPVILLTAKSDTANSIKGLNTGADVYISKPFDPAYLLAAIANLLENRERIKHQILNLTSASKDEDKKNVELSLNESDRELLERIHSALDAHLSDENYSAKDLAESVCMSYSTLYSRIKALTGQTPQTFIITYRMNQAMERLQKHDKSITEIGYEVGFSSVHYFSRSFKKHFGKSPSEV